jgi:hypothetical protein
MLLRSKLHECIVRVESFLLRAGAALGIPHVVLEAPPPADLNVGSGGVVEEFLYMAVSPPIPCPA